MKTTRRQLRKLILKEVLSEKKKEQTGLSIELNKINKQLLELYDKIVISHNPFKLAEPYATGISRKGAFGNVPEEQLMDNLKSLLGKSNDQHNIHSFLMELSRLVPEQPVLIAKEKEKLARK